MSVSSLARTLAVAAALGGGAVAVGAAERSLNQTIPYPFTDGKRVVIELADHDVEVRAADIDEIRVTTELAISGLGVHKADRWIEAHTPVVSDGPEELRVVSTPAGSGFLAFGYLTASARVRVLLPHGSVPDITTSNGAIRVWGDYPLADPLRLRSAGGTVSFQGAAGSIDARTVSGDVHLDVVRPLGSLVARTSSGSVSLSGGARDAEVDTASGAIRVDDLSGSARLATTTGRISARWVRLDAGQRVGVRAASGAVNITIPPTSAPRGTITTTGGAIRCDLAGAVHESDQLLRLDGDGASFDVETASGDVLLAAGDTWDPERLP